MLRMVDCRIGDIRASMKTYAERSNFEVLPDEVLEKEG
jgi:hypothetical protein